MAQAVSISATFLTGRYHGEEWPPSPARLVRALVAGVKTGGYRELWPRVEAGFRWLETRPAPLILARPAAELRRYRLAVPNNDMDSVARDWAAGRPADPARLRTMKNVAPRLVEGAQPHVRYVWPLEENEDAARVAAALEPMANCLYSLGWGVDMAYAVFAVGSVATDGYQEWTPGRASGQPLAVPVPGFLDDLEATYTRFIARAQTMDTDTRPTVYRLERYAVRGAPALPHAIFGLRTVEGGGQFSKPWHAAMEVAAWLRHAAAEALKHEEIGVDIAGFVLGHGSEGGDPSFRMSFVPMPSIGHEHADGRIRRAMLVEPAGASGAAVERLRLKLDGERLTAEGGAPVCTLEPPAGGAVIPFYTRPARVWRSVTPVVLHGYNTLRGGISLAKTEALLLRAFEMAGYGAETIGSLAFQPAPLWAGTGAAGAMRVPRHLARFPRYHVEVRFRDPAPGPVLAGIGRHYGIGLFAAAGGE